ncbi:cytoplasmic protein [Thiovibrio sp. JS02]
MSARIAIFAFAGEPACFAHALLNALDMREKGFEVKLIIEGKATALLPELVEADKPFAPLFARVRAAGLIDCVCRACAGKMGTLAAVEASGLPLCDEMSGHPGMARYLAAGYTIVTI